MEETTSKREREENHVDKEEEESLKRQKSYKDMVSIVEENEEEINEDFSSLIAILQQELCSTADDYFCCSSVFADQNALLNSSSSEADRSETIDASTVEYCSLSPPLAQPKEKEEDDERERVIRRLLEASDDELGIPNAEGIRSVDDDDHGAVMGEMNGEDFTPLADGLWELEDDAANYYTLVQSELSLWP
ncbi:hypothetical protein Nepgr_027991 [Nepenthes gracilis]|uniref:Uncharacterized protein n=1 Tax=Nepenthes gracilis TaxID=150966 RepID=A0AAD3T9U4_NEPGR|nr:hypothetical protein Nepgr_027991 [Nepenthes gracilis]